MTKPQASIKEIVTPPHNGLHLIGNLNSQSTEMLNDFKFFKGFIDNMIENLHLNKLGEVYYNFENGGFTGVVCLSESHLSIHTWPEINYITFDVFLSNFLKDNTQATRQIYGDTIKFFSAKVLEEKILNR